MANYVSGSIKPDAGKGKTKITPQYIYNILTARQKSSIVAYFSVFILVLFLSLIFGLILLIDLPFGGQGTQIAKIILTSLPLFAAVIILYVYFHNLKKITENEYTVIIDRIERIVTDDKLVRRGGRSVNWHMQHAMYLYYCGRIVISHEETFTQAEGDTVYVLVTKKHPTKPIMIFNDKYYELVGLNTEEPKKQKQP